MLTATITDAQTSDTTYYNNERLQKKKPKKKAKFAKIITKYVDESVITEIKDIKKNKIIRRKGYKGVEPYGIWITQLRVGTDTIDYDFELVYSDEKCKDADHNKENLNDTLSEELNNAIGKRLVNGTDSTGFTTPKISTGDSTIYRYIVRSIRYPHISREAGIQGTVYVHFRIAKSGKVEYVHISKGINIELDKEAFRVIRELTYSAPMTIEGEVRGLCFTMPIKFTLR